MVGGEAVVKLSKRGIWCVDSWEGVGKEYWIVVGGVVGEGGEGNLSTWKWDEPESGKL